MGPLVTIDALGLALLRACCSASDRDAIGGDASEEYADRERSRGARLARLWLWRELMTSAPALLLLRLRRFDRATPFATSAVAVAIGCTAVIAVQSLASAAGSGLSGFGFHGVAPLLRVFGSVVAFASGGCAAAWISSRAPSNALAPFCAVCVGLSVFFLWPVAAIVYAAGPEMIVYHLLLLALIVPSIGAGSMFAVRAERQLT
jgi:hypothetical protein